MLWLLRLGLMLASATALMTEMAQQWEQLLFATGGALNLAKCYWYGVEWMFTPTGEAKMNPGIEGPSLTLMAGAKPHISEHLQRISTADGQRTLGVRLSPDGNKNAEHANRTLQACKMGQRIRAAPLGREHIVVGFCSIWKMMIQYPLGATCFSTKQCQQIQTKYLPYSLSKMGINRTTATAVRHGPAQYGGMEVFNLEMEQGIQHACLMISHLQKDDEVGRMFQITLDHLQLQAGVSWSVLSQPGHMQRHYVNPCYVSNTWDFLDQAGLHLQQDDPTKFLTQRQQDTFIIEIFSELPDITPTELKHAQRCRLYLGISTIADITESNGTHLCDWAMQGNQVRSSVHIYPRQDCPSPWVWNTWNNLLCHGYCHQSARRLDQPLGRWYRGHVSQVWDTVLEPTTGLLYIWMNNRVRVYECHGRSRKQYRHLRPHPTNSFPVGCIPVSGIFQSGRFIISGYSKWTLAPAPSPTTEPPDFS
jgi:hypothetical protein